MKQKLSILVAFIATLAIALACVFASTGGTFTLPASTAVTSITQSGTLATITLASTSGINSGDRFFIYGSSVASDNAVQTVTVASGTTLTYPCAVSGSRTGTIVGGDITNATPLFNAFLDGPPGQMPPSGGWQASVFSLINTDAANTALFYVPGFNDAGLLPLIHGASANITFTAAGKGAIQYIYGFSASTSNSVVVSGGKTGAQQ